MPTENELIFKKNYNSLRNYISCRLHNKYNYDDKGTAEDIAGNLYTEFFLFNKDLLKSKIIKNFKGRFKPKSSLTDIEFVNFQTGNLRREDFSKKLSEEKNISITGIACIDTRIF